MTSVIRFSFSNIINSLCCRCRCRCLCLFFTSVISLNNVQLKSDGRTIIIQIRIGFYAYADLLSGCAFLVFVFVFLCLRCFLHLSFNFFSVLLAFVVLMLRFHFYYSKDQCFVYANNFNFSRSIIFFFSPPFASIRLVICSVLCLFRARIVCCCR